MPNFKDITGQRFGQLTAVGPTDKRQGTNIVWNFLCDCGRTVERTTSHIPADAALGLNKLKVKPSIDLIWEINYGKLGIACTRTL